MAAAQATIAKGSLTGRLADLGLVAGVVAIVAMIILPLPTLAVDILVGLNITFGVLLLLTTLYIKSSLEFSSFPSVLLISTLFRLALSIATTRMILIEAHAGHIIQTFGEMVAGGNLIVGLVVFLIITVVNFIVIAKGAERVAEVAARFSLDAMPGKQLSIDSDLRSGLIDKDGARQRRRTLEQESKLHGSLDGAMKFVKGDAIASIVIVIINLIGGLGIGMLQRDMDFSTAIRTYSILTIGEGLVAIIPALLSAMAAGMIVTRSADEDADNLGHAIQRQLGANPRVLIFGGAIAWLMALVPGFPTLVFLALGALALLAGLSSHYRTRPFFEKYMAPVRGAVRRGPEPAPTELIATPREARPVAPLRLQVFAPGAAAAQAHALAAGVKAELEGVQQRVGLPLPSATIDIETTPPADGAPQGRWRLLAFEAPIGGGLIEGPQMLAEVPALAREALRRHLPLFVGVQEVTTLLNRVGAEYPEVVKEAVRAVPTVRIAEVMRRLIEEETPVRNLRDVLEAVAEAGQQEREAGPIADLVRISIKRYILAAYAPDGVLKALIAGPELEARIRAAARATGSGQPAMEPAEITGIVRAVREAAERTGAAVLVTGFDVRRPLRKLIEPDLFDLPVLAFNELSPAVKLEVVGQVAPPAPALPPGPGSSAEADANQFAAAQ